MPSKFIKDQAELLFRAKDAEPVLDNLREKYTTSSFPSQMSRCKQEWYIYEDRHPEFKNQFEQLYKNACLKIKNKSALKILKQYGRDSLSDQVKKRRSALSNTGLTGDESIDSAIGEIKLLPSYMDKYRLSDEDKVVSTSLAKKSLESRSMDCINIENPDELLEKCKNIIKNLEEDPFMISAALAVVTGRRSIELLNAGCFAKSEKKGSFSCLFSGAAKKKVVCENYVDIPLLMKFKYVIKALYHIRNEIPCNGLTNAEINSKYSHKLGDAAKILTGELGVRFHDLRCLYGNMSFQMYENNCSINIWLKSSLLHESLDTSVFYSRCKLGPSKTNIGRWDY